MKAQLLSALFCVTIGCTVAIDATTITKAGKAAAMKNGYSAVDIDFMQAWLNHTKGKSLDAVSKALSAGANPNSMITVATDEGLIKDKSALIDAVMQEDREAVRVLLSFGANPLLLCHGLTALEWAARSSEPNEEILALLLGGTSDLKEKNKALFGSNAQAKRFLLEHGADVNAVAVDGETVLMKAVQDWDIDSIQLLLKYKVDVNKKDKRGKTALDHAFFELELVREIQKDKNDKTAKNMHESIQQIIKTLEAAGAQRGSSHIESARERKASKAKEEARYED